jgi:phosphoglycolate phosphatase-like HAD superfamily hydrolase
VTWGAGTPDEVVEAQPDVVAETVDELRAALLG